MSGMKKITELCIFHLPVGQSELLWVLSKKVFKSRSGRNQGIWGFDLEVG